MVDTVLVVFSVVSVILLFVSMILSSMASSDAKKSCSDCKEGCHKYSMWSALVTGVAVAIAIVVIIIYVYTSREHLRGYAQKHVGSIHSYLGTPSTPVKAI